MVVPVDVFFVVEEDEEEEGTIVVVSEHSGRHGCRRKTNIKHARTFFRWHISNTLLPILKHAVLLHQITLRHDVLQIFWYGMV